MKTVEQRLIEWSMSSDTGSSSQAIAAHMTGTKAKLGMDYPSDPSDLGRCLRLLEKIPEWKERIPEMAQYSPGWAGIISKWDEICKCMQDEVGIDWSKGDSAPKTYDMMKLAQADGYRNDPQWECTFYDNDRLSSCRKVR